ncbi:hypothetical protein MRB53_035506 [Persea americana]|uniref:Uncharacterized protein n=1 Tax=Persea americana TaxID=3435 RepID=A0ACC2K4U5_PERAE|nr:hypothetical protein MRB53_035506 [Persea americana]
MNTKASSSSVLVAAVAWFVLVTLTALQASLEGEAEALLQWKSSLQTQSLFSWFPNQTKCLWVGISCNDAGSVTQINLPNAALHEKGGTLIARIVDLIAAIVALLVTGIVAVRILVPDRFVWHS